MANQKQTIQQWLNTIQAELIANYNRLGLKASGRWEKSLEQFETKSDSTLKIGIKANDYSEYMENGRRANKKQDADSLRKWVGWAGSTFLAQWVKDKGLSISPFAVAWKIAKEGVKVPNKHNAGGLVSDVVTSEKIDQLSKDLTAQFVESFKSELRNVLEK